LWDLADRDLFSDILFPSTPQGTFLYILSGTDTYGELKGLVAKGATENGSDGTVRASSASLNSIKFEVDFRDPANPHVTTISQKNESPVFKLIERHNHSTIVPDGKADHPAYEIIKRCLSITNTAAYDALRTTFDAENQQLYETNRVYCKNNTFADPINRFQQFVVRVLDNMGNAVTDYRLDFHVVDDSINVSTWTDEAPPEQFAKYKAYNARIIDEVISDVEQHSVDPSYRTFFINIDALNKLMDDLMKEFPQAYIAMNFDALPSAQGVSYDTDLIKYVPLNSELEGKSFFKENTTTLIEIKLQLSVDKTVYDFPKADAV